jgi:serine/threonine protein kinase
MSHRKAAPHSPPSGREEHSNKVRIVHRDSPTAASHSAAAAGMPPTPGSSGLERSKQQSQFGNADFAAKYTLAEQIGKGASSTVWKCVHKETGGVFAAKVIDLRPFKFRERFSIDRLRREVEIMRRLEHPNIIHMQVHVTSSCSTTLHPIAQHYSRQMMMLAAY